MWTVILAPLKVLGLVVAVLSFVLYAIIQLLCGSFFKTQNLKKRYNANWGLVTGSSSGNRPSVPHCCASTCQIQPKGPTQPLQSIATTHISNITAAP
jgi:hypothetical protein